MCGPAGAGKTTVARDLERSGFVRLSFDEEAWRRGFRAMPLAKRDHDAIELELRDRLVRLVRAGRDVVLDFSFWSRALREEYRELLGHLGVTAETIYVDTPRETVLARMEARAANHADDFRLPTALAAEYFERFEAPTPDEGPLTVTGSTD